MPASEPCSAAKWLRLAQEAIANANGRLPVITGGTGLYIKALMEGLSPIPDAPPQARAEATALWQEQGATALKERDPAMSAQLKDGDTQRHIRALEVLIATGKSLSYWQGVPREKPYPDTQFEVEVIDVPREELYRRCDARFEVRTLHALALSPTLPAMNAVGVPELIGYLEGKWDLAEATQKAQQATRNYAKRQLTWFRNQL
jgi:tRNA dimethylallyltransferase